MSKVETLCYADPSQRAEGEKRILHMMATVAEVGAIPRNPEAGLIIKLALNEVKIEGHPAQADIRAGEFKAAKDKMYTPVAKARNLDFLRRQRALTDAGGQFYRFYLMQTEGYDAGAQHCPPDIDGDYARLLFLSYALQNGPIGGEKTEIVPMAEGHRAGMTDLDREIELFIGEDYLMAIGTRYEEEGMTRTFYPGEHEQTQKGLVVARNLLSLAVETLDSWQVPYVHLPEGVSFGPGFDPLEEGPYPKTPPTSFSDIRPLAYRAGV